MQNTTNPQPSGSPLNLLYKGVFSTRKSMNNKSHYGQYLDKLYQVMFLGIGTLPAQIVNDIVNAVMLRQTSIDGKVETYKATRDRYHESVKLEALGGEEKLSAVNDVYSPLAHQFDPVKPASVLEEDLSMRKMLVGNYIESIISRKETHHHTLLTEIITSEVLKQVEMPNEIIMRRLNSVKSGEFFPVLLSMGKSAKALLDRVDSVLANPVVRDTIVQRLGEKLQGEALREALDFVEQVGDRTDKDELPASQEPLALSSLIRTIDIAEQLETFNMYASAHQTEVLTDDVLAERLKVEYATYMIDAVSSKMVPRQVDLTVTDRKTLGVILRKSEVALEMAYKAERAAKDAIKDIFHLTADSDKKASLMHYIMYTEDRSYKTVIDKQISRYLDAQGFNKEFVIDSITKVGQDLLKEYLTDTVYFDARKALEGLTEGVTDFKVNTLKNQVMLMVQQMFSGGVGNQAVLPEGLTEHGSIKSLVDGDVLEDNPTIVSKVHVADIETDIVNDMTNGKLSVVDSHGTDYRVQEFRVGEVETYSTADAARNANTRVDFFLGGDNSPILTEDGSSFMETGMKFPRTSGNGVLGEESAESVGKVGGSMITPDGTIKVIEYSKDSVLHDLHVWEVHKATVQTVIEQTVVAFGKYLDGGVMREEPILVDRENVEQAIAMHTKYYDVSPSYRQAVDDTLTVLSGGEANKDFILDLHESVIKQSRETQDYKDIGFSIGEKLPKHTETRMLEEAITNVRKLPKQAVESGYLGESQRVNKVRQPATIQFDHEIKAEDSKGYIAVLDVLYQEFQSMAEQTEYQDPEQLTPGGQRIKNDALITKHLLNSERLTFGGQELPQDVTASEVFVTNIAVKDEDILAEFLEKYIGIVDGTGMDFTRTGRESLLDGGEVGDTVGRTIGQVDTLSDYDRLSKADNMLEQDTRSISVKTDKNPVIHEYEQGVDFYDNNAVTNHDVFGNEMVKDNTQVNIDVVSPRIRVKQSTVLDYDSHGELWNDQQTYVYDKDESVLAEITSEDPVLTPYFGTELIEAEMSNPEQVLTYSPDLDAWGELTESTQVLTPELNVEMWGELTNETQTVVYVADEEVWGELANDPTTLTPEFTSEILAMEVPTRVGFVQKEYEIAVLGCAEPNLKYRRRPDLEPDKKPDDPLFEWICTEGYVCDDWLIVPLKDFNFENTQTDGFYDPVTLKPYFPTGQYDNDGDPYVLPPYSVLNEPISNGVDVGGKFPMSIDPCNLYSYIEYIVKIYDAYKGRFHASSPTDTMSRVMNMLYEQTQKLVAEWDETKGYTIDELWRIYRFIRWMAIGITNRFYRVKLEYTYGDYVENFELFPFSYNVTTQGSSRKFVEGYGNVLEGHPIVPSLSNKAFIDFEVPKKTRTSTISFELGNKVPDRPDDLLQGGVVFSEDFETDDVKLSGTGWEVTQRQSGRALAVEENARRMTYKTNTFNVPENASNPTVHFNYGIDTNMESALVLKKKNGTTVWTSRGNTPFARADINPIAPGDYYFEVTVPQTESDTMTNLTFTATQIQNEWLKTGYITDWRVDGNTIYEEENTPGFAMVINPQWMQDSEYEMEVEFYTEDVQANYGLIDWIGVVLNYKDYNNYYMFGTWSHLDSYAKGGLYKKQDGVTQGDASNPVWTINPDFRFRLSHWHKLKAIVKGNKFTIYIDGTKYLEVTDNTGWGYGACGLAAFSNPLSSFRNFKYKGKPRFDCFIDNVVVETPNVFVPVPKPKYAIDFFMDDTNTPRINDYYSEGKRAFSFPILEGEHKGEWVFQKVGDERSIPQDASFVDNIVIKGIKPVKVEVVEEFIGCGGHLAVKLLIENLLEYYRRHHQGCKGERNIWIIE